MSAGDDYEMRMAYDAKRLRAALDKALPPSSEVTWSLGTYFDPWLDLFGDVVVGPYSSEIDLLAIDVLRAVRDRSTFDLVDDHRRGLAAEMFMHMLAVWLCDYGSSPRGISPANQKIACMWDELIDKWEAYYRIAWGSLPQDASAAKQICK